ncbi:hypothetical protein [Rickettsia endosymbiont of Orchestes rusci]|uniref:hypothetical protein n=1 Tax=Rickettsia endosymbiont of Orchestes rusci TaxID=3066250 RepID=UPI00313E811F
MLKQVQHDKDSIAALDYVHPRNDDSGNHAITPLYCKKYCLEYLRFLLSDHFLWLT